MHLALTRQLNQDQKRRILRNAPKLQKARKSTTKVENKCACILIGLLKIILNRKNGIIKSPPILVNFSEQQNADKSFTST